eukprot:GILJ01010105.1.p1 GENE.GILJ01010105.1~~GILJ01010105.1.p1  ORF type:complete len:842 (-),score=85.70 GILJ01010105.1:121-2559(-)
MVKTNQIETEITSVLSCIIESAGSETPSAHFEVWLSLLGSIARYHSESFHTFFSASRLRLTLMSLDGKSVAGIRLIHAITCCLGANTQVAPLCVETSKWVAKSLSQASDSLTVAARHALVDLMIEFPAMRPEDVDVLELAMKWLISANRSDEHCVYVRALTTLVKSCWHAEGGLNLTMITQTLLLCFAFLSDDDFQSGDAVCELLVEVPQTFVQPTMQSLTGNSNVQDAVLYTFTVRFVQFQLSPAIGSWAVALLQGLAANGRIHLLTELTRRCAKDLVLPQLLSASTELCSLEVLEVLLLGYRHSVDVFLSCLPDLASAVVQLQARNSIALPNLERLLYTIILYLHPGHPERYRPLLEVLSKSPSPDDVTMKQLLAQRVWCSPSVLANAVRSNNVLCDDSLRLRDMGSFVGLENLGNTCYLNSVIQALFMTEAFRNMLICPLASSSSPVSCLSLLSLPQQAVTNQLVRLFAFMSLSRRATVPPRAFLSSLSEEFRRGVQQDASEFSKYLLDVVEANLARSHLKDAVNDVFGGQWLHQVECSGCLNVSSRTEEFLDIPVSFDPTAKETSSLENLLANVFASETLTGDNAYMCEYCQTKQDARRRHSISRFPSYLIITLNRFWYDLTSSTRRKLLCNVDYPVTLRLPVGSQQLSEEPADQVAYEIYAVIVHSGTSAEHGHYYCFAHEPSNNIQPSNAQWFLFNDGDVSKSSLESIQMLSRRFPSDLAYMLFYKRGDVRSPLASAPIDPVLVSMVERDNKRFQETSNQQRQWSSRSSISRYRTWKDDDDRDGVGGTKGYSDPSHGGLSGARFVI